MAIPDLATWACQWTQPTTTSTTTNIHPVLPCYQTNGSLPSATKRWNTFLQSHLPRYAKLRNQIQKPHSVSRMSCYLNWGIVSIFRLCHDLNTARTSSSGTKPKCEVATIDKYEEEIIKWREFSYAHVYANPDSYDSAFSVPAWASRYLQQQEREEQGGTTSQLPLLEGGHTTNPTWNAMQQYLETTGELHNNARIMLIRIIY